MSNYYNLVDIFTYRFKDFGILEAKYEALKYLSKLKEIFLTKDCDFLTINFSKEDVEWFIENVEDILNAEK